MVEYAYVLSRFLQRKHQPLHPFFFPPPAAEAVKPIKVKAVAEAAKPLKIKGESVKGEGTWWRE